MSGASASGTDVNVAGRLDRLPLTSVHRTAIAALAFAYFFELGDLNTFAYAAPAVLHQWHVPLSAIAAITSMSFAGMFIGATCGGWFADRFGRRPALIGSVALYTLFSLLNAFAWNVAVLGLTRFVTGIGLSALTIIANTYISEFFPTERRGRIMAIVFTIGLVGIPATAWVARFVVPLAPWSWRMVFVWGGLGAVSMLLMRRMVESPRWQQSTGRADLAESVLVRLETVARSEFGQLAPPRPMPAPRVVAKMAYPLLFRAEYLPRTLILTGVWVFQTLGFYGFAAWVPTLLTKEGFSVVHSLGFSSVMSLGGPLGALMAISLAERVDRKWFITVDSLAVVVFGLLYGASHAPLEIMLFGFLTVFFLQAFPTILSSYTPELFPTSVRSSGMGLTYGVGRLANVIGPFIVSSLYVSTGYLSVFVYIACCWLAVAGVVGIFGPATRRRTLEELSGGAAGHSVEAQREGSGGVIAD